MYAYIWGGVCDDERIIIKKRIIFAELIKLESKETYLKDL